MPHSYSPFYNVTWTLFVNIVADEIKPRECSLCLITNNSVITTKTDNNF